MFFNELTDSLEVKIQRSSINEKPGGVQRSSVLNLQSRGLNNANFRFENNEIKQPEFDLVRIFKVSKAESLFSIAIQKTVERLINSGFTIETRNKDTAKFLRSRLSDICARSDMTFSDYVEMVSREKYTYSNSFTALKRKDRQKGLRPVKVEGKVIPLDPIFSIEVANPVFMQPVVNKNSNIITHWILNPPTLDILGSTDNFLNYNDSQDSARLFKSADMMHFKFLKASGFLYGMPFIIPVLNDISEMRKLEELMSILSFQRAYPLIHVAIGNDLHPSIPDPRTGVNPEVESISRGISQAPLEGFFVTDGRVSIQEITTGADPEKLSKAIEHYHNRVTTGMGITTLEAGSNAGTSRASAFTLSKEGVSRTTFLGMSVEREINFRLIDNLLREAGIDPEDEKRNAKFTWNVIDQESRILAETHSLSKYHGNLITIDETRKEIGMDPISKEEERRLYFMAIEVPRAEEEGKISKKYDPKPTTTSKPAPKKASQIVSGKNQHGGRNPTKEKQN